MTNGLLRSLALYCSTAVSAAAVSAAAVSAAAVSAAAVSAAAVSAAALDLRPCYCHTADKAEIYSGLLQTVRSP